MFFLMLVIVVVYSPKIVSAIRPAFSVSKGKHSARAFKSPSYKPRHAIVISTVK